MTNTPLENKTERCVGRDQFSCKGTNYMNIESKMLLSICSQA